MNYEVTNKWTEVEFGGSGLQGFINIGRDELVKRFGEPEVVNGPQIIERWFFSFDNGVKAIISRDRKCEENEWLVSGFGKYDPKTKENLSIKAINQLLAQ